MDDKTKMHANALREWVQGKLATGNEPPWSWFRLMKLREDIDAVLAAEASHIRVASVDGVVQMPDMISVNMP